MLQEVKDLDASHGWPALFQRINLESRENKSPLKAARLPKNRTLNRYRDVLPFDHSRVILKDSDTDYINGNLVEVPSVKRYYILTQGPLSHTCKNFWQMVWEQRTIAIVMLNKIIEKNQVKCHQYFPDEPEESPKCQLEFGNIRITNKRERHTDAYIVRHLQVENIKTGEERIVYQFHYTAWPDFGTPQSSESFLEFLYDVRNSGAFQPNIGPTVIHCSAGIGRSGTFIVVDAALAEIERSQNLINFNVKNMLIDMRRYRAGLIQTPDQLRFSYITILEGCYHYMHALYYEAYWQTEGMEEPKSKKPKEDDVEDVQEELDSSLGASPSHKQSSDREHYERPAVHQNNPAPDLDSSSSSEGDTEQILLEDIDTGSSSDSLVSEDSASSKSDDESEVSRTKVATALEDRAAIRPPMPVPQDQGDTSVYDHELGSDATESSPDRSPDTTNEEIFEPLIEENINRGFPENELFEPLVNKYVGISEESEVISNQLVSDTSQGELDSEHLENLADVETEPKIFENPYYEDNVEKDDADLLTGRENKSDSEDSEVEAINEAEPYIHETSSSSEDLPVTMVRKAQPYKDPSGPTVDIDFSSREDVSSAEYEGVVPELSITEPSSEALTTVYSADSLPAIAESYSGEELNRISPDLAESMVQEQETEYLDEEDESSGEPPAKLEAYVGSEVAADESIKTAAHTDDIEVEVPSVVSESFEKQPEVVEVIMAAPEYTFQESAGLESSLQAGAEIYPADFKTEELHSGRSVAFVEKTGDSKEETDVSAKSEYTEAENGVKKDIVTANKESPEKERPRSASPVGKKPSSPKKRGKSKEKTILSTDLSKTSSRVESPESSGTDDSLREAEITGMSKEQSELRKRKREDRKKATQDIVDNIKKKSKNADQQKKTTQIVMIVAAVAVCLVAVGAGVYFSFFRAGAKPTVSDHYGI